MKKRTWYLTTGLLLISILGISTNVISNYLKSVEASDQLNHIVDNNESNELETDIREVAFKQLSDEQKSLIKGTWEEARTEITVAQPETTILYDESYAGKEVIAVEFNLNVTRKPNNMIVLVSQENAKLIGLGLID
ncbi:MAG: hypothetical protein Q4Q00_11435 [Turicibacter sp.]|nr:hypothetical protein [Turicibacter sp.]